MLVPCSSTTDGISCHGYPGRAGRTVVIDIVDWDLGQAKLIEYTLPTCAVAIAMP